MSNNDALARLFEQLIRASTPEDVVEAVVTSAGPAAGASWVGIAVTGQSGTRLHHHTSDGEERLLELGAELPSTAALIEGTTSVEIADERVRSQLGIPLDVKSAIAVALRGSDGIAGSIIFGFREFVRDSDDGQQVLAQSVALLVARHLEDASINTRTRSLVRSIREELLATPDPTPGLEAHGAYLPPWTGIPLGGDWFDVFPLDGGGSMAVIGDVAGHGIAASPTMLSLRAYVRAVAIEDPRPAEMLERIDDLLRRFEPSTGLATLALAVHDPDTKNLRLVNAGLPAPILRRRDGTVSIVEGGRARLVGTDMDRSANTAVTIEFHPGDSIVFVTDGVLLPVLEVGPDIHSIRDIVDHAGDDSLASLVAAILEPTESTDLRIDDATILALRSRNPEGQADEPS